MHPINRLHSLPPLRIALVGITGYGQFHLENLLRLQTEGLVIVAAAVVINPESAQAQCSKLREMGCRIYGRFESMLEQEAGRIDLCSLPTGISWHCSMTIAALEAGMHVLVEKPAAASLEEIAAMQRARDACHRQVFVGFQYMYLPELYRVQRLLQERKMGKLRRIKVCAMWPRSTTYYRRNGWAGKLAFQGSAVLDSPANNAMAHFVLMALFLARETAEDAARISHIDAELYRAQPIESFDTISARIYLKSGIEILLNLTHSSDCEWPPVVEVQCEEGGFAWHEKRGFVCERFGQPPMELEQTTSDAREQMFRNILFELQGGTAHACSLEMAAEHTRFIHTLHKSVEIRPISNDHLAVNPINGENFIYVRGLTEDLLKAHENYGLLSEFIDDSSRIGVLLPLPATSVISTDRVIGTDKRL